MTRRFSKKNIAYFLVSKHVKQNVTKLVTLIKNGAITYNGDIVNLVIKTNIKKNRTKIYRWLQRHKAFPWMIDGKNYSKLSNRVVKSKEHLDSQENLHGGLDFAVCDGDKFYINYFKLEEYPEIKEEFYNYLKANIGNGIHIYKQLVVEEEDLKFIFGKREINPDCEQCNIFQLFQLKKRKKNMKKVIRKPCKEV